MISARSLGTALLATLTVGAATLPAHAIDVEKLVMPGEVIRGHADLEAECAKCHAPFRAQQQKDLCLDCHRDVGDDLQSGVGFHGRAPGISDTECRDCHTDHKGRTADVVRLDPASFDHTMTDYPLRGAHARVACERCHEPPARHREAPGECVDCHRSDDTHDGRLGGRCASCHTERSWSEARFDHDSTGFPLEARHRDVECSLCHPGERYKNTAKDCESCHRLNDEHLGRFGKRCETCHSAAGWTPARFDHARDTRFPLKGGHREAACDVCHPQGIYEPKLSTDCISCHRTDDVHRGRNGADCERCHNERSWTAEKFDHDRMTRFPLRGAHRTTRCERCHTGTLGQEKLEKSCWSCHEDDDVHRGQEGMACDDCHNETGWANRVFFEHDLTGFPLLGLHAVAACEQCHASPRFEEAPSACVACHADEDVHLRRLGSECARCHNPNGWSFWRFDHGRDTSFALHGAHEKLDCDACHRVSSERKVDLPKRCDGCHAKDDPHFGAFGRDCTRCHGDSSWDDVRMGIR